MAPLVEEILILGAWSPKARLYASVSNLSLSGVEVPWALMYCTCSGDTPALAMASVRQSAMPSPSGCGAVMWCASHVAAYLLSGLDQAA